MEANKAEGNITLRYKDEEEDEDEEDATAAEIISYGDDGRIKRRVMTDLYGKRGSKAAGGSSMPPSCQVDGCDNDLSDAKPYYRRHKVCGHHAKAPAVLITGLQQRFCQQCSRFHELPEFDDSKRSCRRRLAGHNERRRKNASDYHGEGSQ